MQELHYDKKGCSHFTDCYRGSNHIRGNIWENVFGQDYMKPRAKIALYTAVFIVVFLLSAVIRIQQLGSAPMKLLAVDWDDTVGTIYKDLGYENTNGHKYDLYLPQELDKTNRNI